MRTAFILPGLLGTELESPSLYGNVLWVNKTRIALGQLDQLGLSANGSTPLPPDGVTMTAGDPLNEYYTGMKSAVQVAVAGQDYAVRMWGYDWRKDIVATGSALAADIILASTEADSATLVCHSQGGLVARAAWFALVQQGKQNLIRRIITVGTPHRGSYAVVKLWSLSDETLDMLQLLTAVPSALTYPGGVIYAPSPWSALRISVLSATWPAFYQLLPTLYPDYEVTDPYRARIYEPSAWPANRGLYLHPTALAGQVFRAFLLNPDSMPPNSVLTTVAGVGVPTPSKLETPNGVGNVAALEFTSQGDGRVTTDSALVDNSARYVFSGVHGSLQSGAWFANNVRTLIFDERPDPEPPPPVVTQAGPVLPVMAGPPLTKAVSGGSACAGRCTC